jgi:hypothetical protein
MAVTFETGDAAYVPTTAAALYTNDSGETSFVKMITIHNTNTTTENVKIYFVPDAAASVGTAGATNLAYNLDILTNETHIIELPGPGIVFKVSTTTTSVVNIWFSVRIDT